MDKIKRKNTILKSSRRGDENAAIKKRRKLNQTRNKNRRQEDCCNDLRAWTLSCILISRLFK
jgi:hypothetical protein